MRLTWSDEAKQDRRRLIGYVEQESLINAIELDDRIDDSVERLLRFPHSGRAGRVERTRELIVSRTPYVAIYATEPTEIVVLRPLHGAQQWPPEAQP